MKAAVVSVHGGSWDSPLLPVTADPQIQQQTDLINEEKKVYLKVTSIIFSWSNYQSLVKKSVSLIVKLF